MSLFNECRSFSIDRSPIHNVSGHQFNFMGPAYIEGGPIFSERRNHGFAYEDVILEEELLRGSGYRVHAARMGSRLVVLKVFHGFRARQHWEQTIAFCRRLMHPRLLHMVGASQPNLDVHFIVFNGEFPKGMERLVASALRDDLTRSVVLGLKMIHGISSALSYLSDESIPLSSIGIENFEIFVGGEGRVVVGINPTGLYDSDKASSLNLTSNDDREMTFTAVNRVLYQECLDRSSVSESSSSRFLEVYPEPVTPSAESAERQKTLEISPGLTNPIPRREFVWSSRQQDGSSLRKVSERFGDFIAVHLRSSSILPLRRFRARGAPTTPHRCVGYRREEINLSTDISTNIIVSHATPAPSEICLICGEVVQEEEIFECICGKGDDSSRSNIKCDSCSVWRHRDCVTLMGPSAHHFMCSTCIRSTLQHPPDPHDFPHAEDDYSTRPSPTTKTSERHRTSANSSSSDHGDTSYHPGVYSRWSDLDDEATVEALRRLDNLSHRIARARDGISNYDGN